MEHEGKVYRISPGRLLLRRIDGGVTEGGVILPDTAKEASRFVVVESSGFYIDQGVRVDVELEPGDQVWLKPAIKRTDGVHGPLLAAGVGWPPDFYVTDLSDVILSSRKAVATN